MKLKPSLIAIIVATSLFLIFSIVAVLTALVPPKHLFLLLGGLATFCTAMLRLEYGLIMLVFALPWTLQIELAKVPGAVYKIGSDDAVLLGLILGWLTHMAIEKVSPFPSSPLNLPILAFITCAAFSFIPMGLTQKPWVLAICGAHFFKWIEFVLIYFIVLRVVNTEQQARRFVVLSLISCAILAVAQVSLTATGRYGAGIFIGETEAAKTVTPGTESNLILGSYYLLFLGIVLSMTVSRRIRHKGLFVAFTVLLFLGVLFTYGRANYLGLASVLTVLTITGGGVRTRLPFIFLIFFLLAMVYFMPTVVKRMTFTVTVEKGGILKFEQSAHNRLRVWRKAIDVFLARPTNPIIGIGFWGSRFLGVWGYATPHNQFIAYLIEMGIIGFAIFCWLMKRLFHETLRLYRLSVPDDPFGSALSIGFMAGVIGVLVGAFFECTLESPRVLGPLWFMTALIVVLKNIKKEEEEAVEEEFVAGAYPSASGGLENTIARRRRFVDKYFS